MKPSEASVDAPGRERVNVLVVDDRPAKLLAMEALLAELGEHVVCVPSGADALRQLLDRDFAVVLLDVNMPEMDGLETAALIRQRPRSRDVPIIFMTAGSDETHALAGYSLGAVDYILTPVIPDVLRTKVRVFVELFRKTEELKRRAEQRVALAEERAARAAAEERGRRTAFLAEAGTAMARSLDLESTVGAVLDCFVPGLADGVVLRLSRIGPDGPASDYRRGVSAERPPELEAALEAARERAVQSLSSEPIREPSAAGVVCPLLARGEVLGTLAVTVMAPRAPYDAATTSLIGEVCGRAAIAIDNCLLYREIRQRDLRKDEFVTMLAHEIRNPLAAVASALGVLDATGTHEGPAVRARDVIRRQLKSLAQFADDLLDMARLTMGRLVLDRSVVHLGESVERVLATCGAAGRTGAYTIDVHADETWISADLLRLDQVFGNLIGNALKYTPPGGRITVRVWPEDDMGVVEIEDSGIGMSPEVAAHAFDLFFQADRTLERSRGGLGIGLTLVRQLVELHGGRVEGWSAGEGTGSRFTVWFPRAARPDADEAPASVAPEPQARTRIVIAEDNKDAREMLRMLLALAGHEVYEVGNGPEAVETIRATAPDVALVDVGLPGFDGYEVARRVRSMTGARNVLLAAVTGYGQPEDRDLALEAGFDLHVVKPIDLEDVRAIISAAERRRREDIGSRSS